MSLNRRPRRIDIFMKDSPWWQHAIMAVVVLILILGFLLFRSVMGGQSATGVAPTPTNAPLTIALATIPPAATSTASPTQTPAPTNTPQPTATATNTPQPTATLPTAPTIPPPPTLPPAVAKPALPPGVAPSTGQPLQPLQPLPGQPAAPGGQPTPPQPPAASGPQPSAPTPVPAAPTPRPPTAPAPGAQPYPPAPGPGTPPPAPPAAPTTPPAAPTALPAATTQPPAPTPSAPQPTPTQPTAEASIGGGLGNTRAAVDATFGQPSQGPGGAIAYQDERVLVRFQNDRAAEITYQFEKMGGPVALPTAQQQMQGLFPSDAQPVRPGEQRPGEYVEVHRSAQLAQALGGNGNFTVSYRLTQDGRVTTATVRPGG